MAVMDLILPGMSNNAAIAKGIGIRLEKLVDVLDLFKSI